MPSPPKADERNNSSQLTTKITYFLLRQLAAEKLIMKFIKDKHKHKLIRRLKILEGQIRGLQDMVEKNTYCIHIITQTSAVKQGLSNIEDILLENHLEGCILNQVKSGQADKAKEEILKVYKLKRK